MESVDTLRSLADSYRSTQAYEELSQILRQIIDVGRLEDTLGEQESLDLFAELGALEGDVLGRIDAAIDAWREVVAIDASDVPALTALETLYVRAGRWEDSIEVLEKRALVLDDDDARRDALLQAAATWEERLDDADRAARLYERVRASDPGNALACERLGAIYTDHGKWTELVELLLERSETLEVVARQIEILHRVARVYERELDDQDSAFYVLQAAFNRDHAHAQTARELERLATETTRWQELLDDYTAHAGELAERDRAAAAQLWTNIGRWTGEHLGDADRSLHALQEALRLDPAHPAALAALAPVYRRGEQWELLATVLAQLGDLATDDGELLPILLEEAELWDGVLADPARAIAAYQRALALDAHHAAALRALEPLYARTNQSEKYLETLQAQLVVVSVDDERAALYGRIAAAWQERFGKLDRAAEALEQLLAIDRRNLGAYSELAGLYEQLGNWEAHVDTLRNHVLATPDADTRGYLYAALGAAYEQRLGDTERAVGAYRNALELAPGDARALDAVARLYEKAGDWESAVDALARLVALGGDDTAKQVDRHTRMARIQATHLGAPAAAEDNLQRALALDGTHLPAITALAKLYGARGDWGRVAAMMERAESHTTVVIDKVRLLYSTARIYHDRLGQLDDAKRLYAAAIALDPEHVEAGRPLAELYAAAEQWEQLLPVLEMLARKATQLGGEPRELVDLFGRAARCAGSLGDRTRALALYQRALDVDAGHVPSLVGRADLLFDAQDWASAAKLYQTILVQRTDAAPADTVHLYHRLGKVRRAMGERDKALDMFDKALRVDPNHRDTLAAVAELQHDRRDWDAVVAAKRGMLATASADQKLELLVEIGGIFEKRLASTPKATAAYVEALDHAPEDRRLLQKLLDLYTETQQWRQVVDTIRRFVALETDLVNKGTYFHAAASVCRGELKALDEAVELYDSALDCFFAQPERLDEPQLARALKSFEAIDQVLTTTRDWRAQEHAYLALIKRLPEQAPPVLHKLQVFLFDGLAEIYRSRLKDYGAAASAFQIAQHLDPNNELRLDGTDRAEILAELYVVAGPDHADKAIEQHRRVLRAVPFSYDSYKALARIYRDTQQHDKRWCLANTLRFLKKADAEDLEFYEQYKPRGLVKAKQPMSPASWAKLAHADENRGITGILAACWQGVAMMSAFPHKDLGIKREDRRQLETDQLMLSRLFVYAATALGVTPPDIYLVDDNKAAEFQLANALDRGELCPSLVVRPQQFHGKTEREVAFLVARRLTFMRPEYYLRMLLPTTTELGVAVWAAIALVQPGVGVPPALADTVQQYTARLRKRMPAHALADLAAAVQRFIAGGAGGSAGDVNAGKWVHAADAASVRAGFVVSGDLDVAARTIAVESVSIGGPPVKDKVKDLVLFSISDELFAIRAQMGIALGS